LLHGYENSYILYLHGISDKYAAHMKPLLGPGVDADLDKLSIGGENGFLWDNVAPEVKKESKWEVWNSSNPFG